MLGLTELDDMVCQWLSRHDLAQCARVSKKWHCVATRHIWHDLSWLNVKKFCKIILDDYLASQHQKLVVGSDGMDQAPPPPRLHLPALSKYGHWIRKLPDLSIFPLGLHRLYLMNRDKAPTVQELLYHLFERCSPNVQVDSFTITIDHLKLAPTSPAKTILDVSLPRLAHLNVKTNIDEQGPRISELMDLMDRCSTTLRWLQLSVNISHAEMKEDQTEKEPNTWTSLQKLELNRCCDWTDAKAFWPWLLRRCVSVETLHIGECTGSAQNLAEGMLAHMPNLDEITLGSDSGAQIMDHNLALFLSASRKGWKTVRFGRKAGIGRSTMDALAEHFSTLEVLGIHDCKEVRSNDPVQVFRSCPNLRTLDAPNRYDIKNGECFTIDAKMFIDLDPVTGLLRPWECERSLKVLKTEVVGIPRPDSKERVRVIQETHPGQGREVQRRVYDRLARLANLETLWLGWDSSRCDTYCLELSLASGLDRLAGLKKLIELRVNGRNTRIGIKEVQWMVRHWPCLRVIDGLRRPKEHGAVIEWLGENHPEIVVK